MNNFFIIILLNILLIFPVYADEALKNESNTELRDKILYLLGNKTERNFNFIQEKKISILKKPLVTEGSLQIKGNTSSTNVIIWDIRKPYQVRYELHQNFVKEIDSNGERIIASGSNPLATALTEAMISVFSGHWENKDNLARISASGSEKNWALDIVPQSVDLQKLIQRISVEGSKSLIQKITILESNNDSTTILLTSTP